MKLQNRLFFSQHVSKEPSINDVNPKGEGRGTPKRWRMVTGEGTLFSPVVTSPQEPKLAHSKGKKWIIIDLKLNIFKVKQISYQMRIEWNSHSYNFFTATVAEVMSPQGKGEGVKKLKFSVTSFLDGLIFSNSYLQWWQLLFGQSTPYVVNWHFSRWSDRPLKCCFAPLL